MIWVFFALIASVTYCMQTEINKHYRVDGFSLNTFRSFFAVLMMVPLIPFMEWPSIPEYYLVTILEAAVSVFGMMAQYNLAAKKNGRVACMHQPIAILLTFLFWVIFNESQRAFLASSPLRAVAIAGAFLIFVISIQFIRRNDVGLSALLAVVPIAVLYSIMTVVSKIALEHGDSLFNISLNFVFLCNVFMLLLSIPVYISQSRRLPLTKDVMISSGSIAFFHTLSWVFACIAIIMTPNPAYVSVILGLAPIWFMAYYRLRGIKDEASPVAGLFMALAAAVLLCVSS